MDFSDALRLIKKGSKMSRQGWNGPHQCVFILTDMNDRDIQIEDFIVIKNVQDKYVPWLASQGDLLAEDWTEV